MKVEVFNAQGCGSCSASIQSLKEAVASATGGQAVWCEIDIVEQIDYAVELGVLSVPAVAIDGRLVFAKLPTTAQLLAALALPTPATRRPGG